MKRYGWVKVGLRSKSRIKLSYTATYFFRACGIFLLLLMGACSQRTLHQGQINAALYRGDAQAAYTILATNPERWMKGKNQLLYFWERATLAWMLGDHNESKEFFMTSDYYVEDMYRNYANEALALFTNDKIKNYRGEDHEKILFQFYQILNFMNLGELENALVQVRRLNLELGRLNDRYKDNKDRTFKFYQRDAFAYVLMGLVYEATDENNNAWIAYKKAIEIYESDYAEFFDMQIPEQLKYDFLRLSNELGFSSDLHYWEKKWKLQYDPQTMRDGNFVFFWMNGLAPIKEEVALEFIISRGSGGWATFSNAQFGLSIPVFIGNNHTQQGSAFSQLEFIKIAVPRYFIRGSMYPNAQIQVNGKALKHNLVEDVSALSKKIEQEHFLVDLGKTLARVAIKKASEAQLRKENENAGAALSLLNYITEQADTRSWESLPDKIYYSRTTIAGDSAHVSLNMSGTGISQYYTNLYKVPSNGMFFQGFHTFHPAKTGMTR